MLFAASKKLLSKKKPEAVACEACTEVIEVEVLDEKLVAINQTSGLTSVDTTQVSGDREQNVTQSRKRRRNYTETDNQNVLHLYYDMGLTYREIHHITGMFMGSIQLRVKKEKNKFTERKRNIDITDELIEQLKQFCIHNEKIDQLRGRT
ncbi:hypothetical protein EDC96DRAFT_550123 [Choanephora cucurbitarum]|nr:hypothetical protein EDC96DRAFT_550123 [Choanephora cucurbitarum]